MEWGCPDHSWLLNIVVLMPAIFSQVIGFTDFANARWIDFVPVLNTSVTLRQALQGKLDIVGIYPNYASAYAAWKAKAQQTVDNALMRYFIVHLHRLLDPQADRRAKR